MVSLFKILHQLPTASNDLSPSEWGIGHMLGRLVLPNLEDIDYHNASTSWRVGKGTAQCLQAQIVRPASNHPNKVSASPRLPSFGPSLHTGKIVTINAQVVAYIQTDSSKRSQITFKLCKVRRAVSTCFGPQKAAIQPIQLTQRLASARAA